MYGVRTEWVDLRDKAEKEEVEAFLERFDLILDHDVDYTVVVREGSLQGDGQGNGIIATCSKAKNVLKCFAVAVEYRGEGITSLLISTLIDQLFSQGIGHCFIFTKPSNVHVFTGLNFKVIQQNADVALLENGLYGIRQALEKMKSNYGIGDGEKAALVMNCNPFTLGHYYLIEKAAKENNEVLVFIVEEDQSLFPFSVRYDLVCRGVRSLKNVKVIPGGEYIISSATFPSYFLKEEGERLKAYVHLDASIFGRYFCPNFHITKRYVGEEPNCRVTRAYNEALKKVLPGFGAGVIEVPRKDSEGEVISASRVRELLRQKNDLGKSEELRKLLPEVTLVFLETEAGREIVQRG
jgi:[citrate (pro-3S)-lyase] ligase